MEANEVAVAASLALYGEAQAVHKREHGRYAEHLWELDLPRELIRAEIGAARDQGYNGYLFGTALMRKDNWGVPAENTVDFLDGSWEAVR